MSICLRKNLCHELAESRSSVTTLITKTEYIIISIYIKTEV